MRICHVITRFIRGGADENTLFSCNGQVDKGHEVHLIYGSEVDVDMIAGLDSRVNRHQVSSLRRSISGIFDATAVLQLRKLFFEISPEIVHTHTSKAGFVGRIAATFAGVPIVIHGVHILPFVNVGPVAAFFYTFLERILVPFTDAYVSVGEGMRRECINAHIGHPSKHYVIPSGMDLRRFDKVALSNKEPWQSVLPGFETAIAGPRFLLLVSRLEQRKRQYDFLAPFSILAAEFPELVLLIAGDGPDRGRIARRIDDLGLAGRVYLTGYRGDIERLMALAEIGLLTSIREGLPRVLVQYARMTLPIVATDIPGVREIVEPNVTGFVTNPTDLADMLPPIRSLLTDAALRWGIVGNLRVLDLRKWSVEYMIEELERLYRRQRACVPTDSIR